MLKSLLFCFLKYTKTLCKEIPWNPFAQWGYDTLRARVCEREKR